MSIGVPWAAGEPDSLLPTDKCSFIQFNTGTVPLSMFDYDCDLTRWFICEGAVPECKPSCPVKTCSKDLALFDNSGKIISPSQYGAWRDTCGRRYLFSTTITDYISAYKVCCSLGMNLLTLETNAEMDCLTTLNNGDMKYNKYFYTSASSLDCRNRYEFCPDTGIVIAPNDTRWMPGQPQIGETALMIMLSPGSPTYFGDNMQIAKYNFICEGPIETNVIFNHFEHTAVKMIIMWTALLPSFIAMCTFTIETSAIIPSIVKVKFIKIRNTQQRRIFIEKCCADSISLCDLKNTTEYISTKSASTKFNKNTPALRISSLAKETETTEISSTALETTTSDASTDATTASTSLSTSTTSTTPTTTTTTTPTTTTTTTTTLPPCIPFTCKPSATKLDSKGLVDPRAVTNGFLKVACDRLYLFSVDKKTWADAATECCSFGMSLITVESWQRLSCISDLMNSADGSGLAGEYLTSLSDYQKEGTYIWCNGNNTTLGNLTWNSREPSGKSATGQEEDCGSITIGPGPVNSNVLNDIDCTTAKQYICETPDVQTCNSYSCQNTSCTVDPVKRAQSIGWRDAYNQEFKSVCGRQYYLHRTPVIYNDARLYCCQMGLEMLSVETPEEAQCLARNPFNFNFQCYIWTSAYYSDEIGCKKNWGWCPSGLNISIGVPWGAGEPNSLDKCTYIQWDAGPAAGPAPLSMFDYNCFNTRWFICEGLVPECKPTCPVKTCTKNSNLFDSSGKLLSSNQYGAWRDTCGRRYLFSTAKADYVSAYKTCCSLGMNLLTLETNAEIDCLTTLNDADMKYNNVDFLTSASSLDCKNRYEFCLDTGIVITCNDTRWNTGECNLGETTLMLKMRVGIPSRFTDFLQTASFNFICEGPIV
ncbi:Hypothetical predicted protein [Cloeon dipterum]|uniref:C-type lectin domain-containing protein n=1 Tax=Cloeon dipterum TaxID=197152 RepID=A0A8S1CQE7_9INSE|nr:Hypothetical predicted protein [Cloeon dipterum]